MRSKLFNRRDALKAAGAAALFMPAIARAQTRKVTLGIVNTISDAPYFIADARGYFRDEGLSVEILPFPSGAKMISSLSTGDLDVSGGAVSAGLYNANEREIAIKIVADKARNGPGYGFQSLIVRKDLIDSGAVKTLADLKGKKVAIPAIGSAGEQSTLNEACLKGGIKFDEVERVYISTPDMFAAMSNKAIDATIVAEPIVSLAKQRGVAERLMTVDQFYPDQQAAVTTFGAPFVKKREQAEAFMRGYLRGVHDYNDSLKDGRIAGRDADDVIGIISKYSGFKDVGILKNVVPAACHPDGLPNEAGLQKDLSFIQGMGLVDKKLTVAQVVDLSFLKAAQAKVGLYSRKG
jgi:NitT/TauT family transport system substrate-binding protein